MTRGGLGYSDTIVKSDFKNINVDMLPSSRLNNLNCYPFGVVNIIHTHITVIINIYEACRCDNLAGIVLTTC